MFSRGWNAFTRETGLESGDTFVMFKLNNLENKYINVCIFKGGDKINDDIGSTALL